MRLRSVLFDLDGTLVNTAPDMVGALNRLLEQEQKAPVQYNQAALQVSNGARALVRFGFGEQLSVEREAELINEFLRIYAEFVCVESHPYEGILECLALCETHRIEWGVITNKPLALAKDVLEGLNLLTRCKVLLGGDSLPVKKPDPVPLLHSAMLLSVAPSECLYLGDHERDIEAARNAGMQSGVAAWGYLSEAENSADWQPDFIFTSPHSLLNYLTQQFETRSS